MAVEHPPPHPSQGKCLENQPNNQIGRLHYFDYILLYRYFILYVPYIKNEEDVEFRLSPVLKG